MAPSVESDNAWLATRNSSNMEVSASESARDVMPLYQLTNAKQIAQIATGSDADIGGISRCHIALAHDQQGDGFARFYGTVSSQIPRNASLERSGYAAFRNKSRPTLFGSESWDTSLYPYLLLRVRNNLPQSSDHISPSLRSALHAHDQSGPAVPRAIHALGLPYPGLATDERRPLFFINVQTDGPVTTDLYQHRLFLDHSKGDQWQSITIPLDDFVLTNTGVVADPQVAMLREKVLSVGISVLLDPPVLSEDQSEDSIPPTSHTTENRTPSPLRRDEAAGRGSQRSSAFDFDLGIQGIYVVQSPEEATKYFHSS
ncbi:hypothetical protein MYAM1_002098 [Malassezia yamatoensis]|uniref:NADH:ubiquinone oxidoreductase intermediate-associated protein 30 domain-containing protein n=1 Tax=Malassezia yamatoensis TaxID=253288 RepID=A0AAJ5YZE0_9BASI|nr:hypothetical protein MYAM1_002098 [Malassezia yamatoensis]